MQERDIFIAAMPKDAAERATYLAQACGDDDALRRRVEQLLVDHEKKESFFLDAPLPVAQMTVDQPFSEKLGTQIGPYKLLQQIGEGGMGVVFMAEQTEPIARLVALKIIKPGMDTRQIIARFEAERQALAMMDHGNIARVLDAGATKQGRPYFVMELVHGVPITKYCDDNRLTPRQRLELFVPVCQAIQHAHQKGIIHRDIKPSNVMVTLYDGKPVPKVIDFGVAKAIDQKLTQRTLFTQYGTMVGTLEYMSPEQAEMSGLGVDTRSDIYSLGVLLYELLTGSTPLSHQRVKEAAYAEILRLIREEDPPKPSTRLIDSGEALASISALRHTEPAKLSKLMRGELDWIVMKTLEKDRNRRYETANGFAQDVQRYLNDETVQACPPSTPYRFRKFARRNKAALLTGASVSAALVTAVVVLAASNVVITAERNAKGEALTQKVQALGEKQLALGQKEAALLQAQTNYLEAKRQEGLAKKQERIATQQTLLAQRRLYASQMNLAMQAWRASEIPRVLELLEGQRPKAGEVDLRGFEWFYLWRNCNIGRLHLEGHTDAVLGVSYSPDGQTVASASSDGTVRLWSSATGQEQMVLRGHAAGPWNVAFSPDGTRLASGGKVTSDVIVWDAATGKQIYKIEASVNGLAFSPDGKTLLGGGSSTRLWDVATGKETANDPEPSLMIGMLRDCKSVATLRGLHTERAEVQVWRAKDGARQLTIPLPEAVTAALSPDGTRIATSAGWVVRLWAVATGKLEFQYSTQSSARGLAFSPDGKRLAAGYEDRRVIVWDVESGKQLAEDVHRDVVWAVAYSPDAQTVASATLGGAINLWDMRPPEEVTSLPIENVAELRFSKHGSTLLLGTAGRTSIVDVDAGVEIALLPFNGVSALSANGERAVWLSDDHKAVVGDVSSGREIARLPVRTSIDGRPAVALSPDGAQAAIFVSWDGDEKVVLWDIENQTERTLISDLSGLGVNCAQFSPDGRFLAVGLHFQWVVVWDLGTHKVKLRFAQQPQMMEILTLSFSPDSNALAVGTNIGAVTLWDVETGERIAAFQGHTSCVNAVTFSPDGEVLVTAGADKTLKLWDARTGQERSTLTGHTSPISHVLFSPDGHTLVAASAGSVKFWRAGADNVLAARGSDLAKGNPPSPARTSTSLALPAGAIAFSETGLGEALLRWPEDAELHRRLGRQFREQEKLAEAASSYREVVRLKPDDTSYASLAEVLHKQQKFTEAESALREAIRLKPLWPWRHDALGSLLLEQAKYPGAELAFREAIRLKPDLSNSHYGLGVALLEQKRFDEALLPLRASSRLNPTSPHIRGRLGSVLLNLGKTAEAEVEFRERIRLAPQEPEGHVQLGRALSQQKKPSEAIAPLREAIRLQPMHPSANEVLGWAFMGQTLFPEAESAFREQVRLNPTNPSAHFGLGQALQKQKRSADAVAPLREAVRLEPDGYGRRDMLAWALLQTGAAAEAELEFREMTRLEPGLVSGHFGLGRALVEQRKFAEAETALREALRIAPEHVATPQLLGQALMGQGKAAEAAELLKKVPAQMQEKSPSP